MDVKSLIGLLNSKNRCLIQFQEITERFAAETEKGDFSGIQGFESRRDAALKAIDLYDRKISEALVLLPTDERTLELGKKVESILEIKHRLVHEILAMDEKIIVRIEEEKARVLLEITQSQKSKDLVKKFKSGWVTPSGEEIDRSL